ncbi:ECs_2282 family putative zinc-binding protein [Serratia marcescens]|uniref:ECs_2282 family putative zinc-binding protein n=1 Tax=Serratia marcescens TaxID=615 RepID=UPI003C12B7A6
MMSHIPFKCPSCNHDLTVHSGTEISDVDDVTGTTCANCGRTVHKDDLIQQARVHAAILVRNLLGKHFG